MKPTEPRSNLACPRDGEALSGTEERAEVVPEEAQSRSLPPVSVAMAVYNGERYIAGAIESVLRQTHQDFEFIIVNDGSTDRTQEILERYAARDRRINVITQANTDQPMSLNRALAAASNDWVAILDADDVCMPHRLETQLSALQREPAVRVLGAYAVRTDERGKKWGVRTPPPTSLPEFERLVERNGQITLVHSTAMMHRPTILELGGYDASFGAAADVELWSRVSDDHVVINLPEPLLYYRVHQKSMSMTRFFEQRLMLRWVRSRQRARRRGRPQPTLEQYRASEGRFVLCRLNHRREDWGRYLRMRSLLARWEGRRAHAIIIRAITLVLAPTDLRTFARMHASRLGVYLLGALEQLVMPVRGRLFRSSVTSMDSQERKPLTASGREPMTRTPRRHSDHPS